MFNEIKASTKSIEQLEAEKVLVEVFRITKLHNQRAMINITNDDLEYLARNIANEYLYGDLHGGIKILKESVTEFFNNASSGVPVEIGHFNRICHSKKQQIQTETHSRALLTQKAGAIMENPKENVAKIKEMLTSTLKPLPYNKNIHAYDENRKAGEKAIAKVQTGFYGDDDLPDGQCYSDGPRLYQKCVNANAIATIESIKNPRLRELYERAWSRGLMNEEKVEFEALRKIEERQPSKAASQ